MDCLDSGVTKRLSGRVRAYPRLMAVVGPGEWGVVKWGCRGGGGQPSGDSLSNCMRRASMALHSREPKAK